VVLLIDNYDSFTFNLVHLIGTAAPGREIRVVRNDELSVEEIERLRPGHIVISPGPCTPAQSGVSNDVIRALGATTPILGVCLGHQCIAGVSGAPIVRATKPVHGKTDQIFHDGKTIYTGVASPFTAARYHSLVVRRESVPPDYQISAWTETGEVMGLRHCLHAIEGVQYHPESFMSEHGQKIMENFLRI
jgi:para-aminobenzoate synthetase component II